MVRNSRGADAHSEIWPDPAGMRTTAAFVNGLRTVRTRSGKSFTELAERSKALGYPQSRSTLHKMCQEEKGKLPSTFGRVEHFLLTCGVPAAEIGAWRKAYQRLSEAPDLVAAEPMPIGEVGDFVQDFADFDRSTGVRPSLTWLAGAFLVGTAAGGAVVAWLV
ncbi:helix-turn-helix domain-containing protein [Lentzea jiangxiensis]|uniref:Uncharacterized protein n=1 Tax=Lentzea jiangxiensis TaxID=641025 RepID=A0A1H0PCU8_9PSEU|nr:helix-turn-helix domain-containing protein [Lentzea jiangxiensis]SDP02912.1 hypothetical protein SAMN05421507_1059 [Lentzea jiangxiensis]